jgi:hypothetical protein
LKTQKLVNGAVTATYQDLSYQFYLNGTLKKRTDTLNNYVYDYVYDNLDRITNANGTYAPSRSFQYDRIGNITYKSDVGNYVYTYGNKPHAVRQTTGTVNITPIEYDANGNMTRRQVTGGANLLISWNTDNTRKGTLIKL